MKKKTISDIRLFKSESQNEYGGYIDYGFGDKKLNAIIKRVVMKLRENEFSLGDFDHLYINFTTCDMAEEMNLSVNVDRYHPWFRYCNIHVEETFYNKLGSPESWNDIILHIKNALTTYFVSEDFDETRILSCVQQAIEQGEDMLMKFKEKVSTKRVAVKPRKNAFTAKNNPLVFE
jgi:hypothetical protein